MSLYDRHVAAGATFVQRAGLELPAWYEGPGAEAVGREYAAAREGAALVDLAERGILAVTGPLRQKFLQGILSSEVASLVAGQGRPAALMDAKGHLIALMRALVTEDAVLLEMPSQRLQAVESALVHYRVAAPVRFAARPAAILALIGPAAREVLARTGGELPDLASDSHVVRELAGGHVRLIRAGDLPAPAWALHVDPEAAPALWDALIAAGAVPMGRSALDALRVEQGRPFYGVDVGEEHLLYETGLVAEYHAAKGCYVGQEVIARLEARGGHVNKVLRGLKLGAPATAGDSVEADGKPVGRITTAAVSPRLGPIAMAYVHRSHYGPGTAVEVAGRPALVTALPFENGGYS